MEMETDLAGKQQHGYLQQEEIRAQQERKLGAQRGGQAQGTLRQGLRIERAEARGRGACFGSAWGRGTSKGHTSPVG